VRVKGWVTSPLYGFGLQPNSYYPKPSAATSLVDRQQVMSLRSQAWCQGCVFTARIAAALVEQENQRRGFRRFNSAMS
jgi:hypothetical protein